MGVHPSNYPPSAYSCDARLKVAAALSRVLGEDAPGCDLALRMVRGAEADSAVLYLMRVIEDELVRQAGNSGSEEFYQYAVTKQRRGRLMRACNNARDKGDPVLTARVFLAKK